MMHACMMTGDPMLLYWRGGTIPVLELVENLQSKGTPCFFSMDAGPNVKVFFPREKAIPIALFSRIFLVLNRCW